MDTLRLERVIDMTSATFNRAAARVQSKVEESCANYLQPRHCEARSDVAIQAAVQSSGMTK
jgi:hypothetical protein